MAKAINIPWDNENIEKSHVTAAYHGFSSLASFIKWLLVQENKKREQEEKAKS